MGAAMSAGRLHPALREALDASGRPYSIVRSRRHVQILIDGRRVQTLPIDMKMTTGRFLQNAVAQIRRAARRGDTE